MERNDIVREIFAKLEAAIDAEISSNSATKLKNLLGQSESGYVFCTGREQAYISVFRLVRQLKEEYGVSEDETE